MKGRGINKRVNEKGFGTIELVFVIVFAVVIIGAGALVWHARQKNDATKGTTASSSSSSSSGGSSLVPGSSYYQAKAADAEDHANVEALQGQLEAYYATVGTYPSQADFYSAQWRTQNMKSLDPSAITSSGGKVMGQAGGYVYKPQPTGCDGDATTCDTYVLSATLHDGTQYTKTSVN